MKHVYITDFFTGIPDLEHEILRGIARVRPLARHQEEDLFPAVRDASALMVWHDIRITEKTIRRLAHCRIIVRCGVGYDNVDIRAAGRRGIIVSNVPDYGVDEVADHALALALALTRKLRIYSREIFQKGRAGWNWRNGKPLYRNRGRVFGILGMGSIGMATALRARACGWRVIFCDPYLPGGFGKAVHCKRVEFDELLQKSDVLSLHTPLTDETRHMINAAALAQMKRTAVLVNTARGGVVDQKALLAALLKKRIAGAGLDVLEQEPPRDDDPLLVAWRAGRLPNVILTPHSAFYSEDGFREMRAKAAEEICRVLRGGQPRNCVNAGFLRKKLPGKA